MDQMLINATSLTHRHPVLHMLTRLHNQLNGTMYNKSIMCHLYANDGAVNRLNSTTN